jgi:hypothetical protein
MRERVFGIETEYALIYHPGRGERTRPSNLAIYPRFEAALRHRVRSLPSAFSPLRAKGGCFLENGGSFHYEATPEHYEHGLLELASPLLEYERAKDELVEDLASEVTAELRRAGYRGEVRIGKNNVDSAGHTFGSHESYWVEDRMSVGRRLAFLPLWLGLWLLSLPVVAWVIGAQIAVLIGLVAGGLAVMGTTVVLAIARPSAARRLLSWLERRVARVESLGGLTRNVHRLVAPLYPVLGLHSRLYGQFHFRAIRRALTAHLVTRSVYTGAGAVVFDGGPLFRIAQRPPFLRAVARIFPAGEERPIYEMRDLFFRPWSAFQSRRRLHLMIGDANLCEWALALRVGSTALVLEAIESGADIDWPELRDPLAALRALCCDSRLREELELADGGHATALALQHRYLEGVRRALAEQPPPLPIWKARILRDWEETLQLLEQEPEMLADRVDWIAKRRLIQAEVPDLRDQAALEQRGAAVIGNGAAASPADRRLRDVAYRAWRTDLRYHELGPRGGYRRLERADRVRRLSAPQRVEHARTEPPADTRAWGRGQAIKWAYARAISGGVAWHRVRVGKLDWRWFRDPLDPRGR